MQGCADCGLGLTRAGGTVCHHTHALRGVVCSLCLLHGGQPALRAVWQCIQAPRVQQQLTAGSWPAVVLLLLPWGADGGHVLVGCACNV